MWATVCTGILQSLSVHFKVILHFYVAFVPNVMRVCRGVEVMFLTIQQSLFRAEPSASRSSTLTFTSPWYSLDTMLVDSILDFVVLIQVLYKNQTHLPSNGHYFSDGNIHPYAVQVSRMLFTTSVQNCEKVRNV